MKKLSLILISLILAIAFVGCGGNAVDENSKYISSFTHQEDGTVVSYDSINPDTPTYFSSGSIRVDTKLNCYVSSIMLSVETSSNLYFNIYYVYTRIEIKDGEQVEVEVEALVNVSIFSSEDGVATEELPLTQSVALSDTNYLRLDISTNCYIGAFSFIDPVQTV